MSQSLQQSKLRFWLYRTGTILKSFKALYSLPSEKVDAFLDSYSIYDHDWADEKKMIKELGPDYYDVIRSKLVDWYCVLNHLCSIGQVEKMYIPPAMDLSQSIMQNQLLFERKMASDLSLKQDDTVLDIGCGRGRVAAHIASLTGATVTGINIDDSQLESAKKNAKRRGLSERCRFMKADLNELPMPFDDASFDAVYHVQVFSLSKDLLALFKDIYRILKPGGKLSCLDWVSLSAYDPKNPKHSDLMKRIKPLVGAIGTPSDKEYVDLMKKAGFKILISEIPSVDGLQAPLIENADKFYKRMQKLIHFFVRYKILPKHFKPIFDRLTKDGEAFTEADRMRLVTSTYHVVAQKPES